MGAGSSSLAEQSFKPFDSPRLDILQSFSNIPYTGTWKREEKGLEQYPVLCYGLPTTTEEKTRALGVRELFYKVISLQSHVTELAVIGLQNLKLNNMLLQILSTGWRQWKYSQCYKEESLIIFRSYKTLGPSTKNTSGCEQQWFVCINVLKDTSSSALTFPCCSLLVLTTKWKVVFYELKYIFL